MVRKTPKQLLWDVFSTYIKLRDTNSEGNGICISCPRPIHYPNSDGSVHASHLYPRSTTYNSLWFHEMNVHASCSHCNSWLDGNIMMYRKRLLAKYGQGVLDELERVHALGQGRKWPDFEYKEMTKHYRKLVKQLKKQRGIS